MCAQGGLSDAEARHKWLLLQAHPAVAIGTDVFKAVFLSCMLLTDDDVSSRLAVLRRDYGSKLSFVVVDEAQAGYVLHLAFAMSDDRRHAPMLRELFVCLGNHFPATRLIVSGTQVDTDLVADALGASRFTAMGHCHFTSLGHFGSQAQRETGLVKPSQIETRRRPSRRIESG